MEKWTSIDMKKKDKERRKKETREKRIKRRKNQEKKESKRIADWIFKCMNSIHEEGRNQARNEKRKKREWRGKRKRMNGEREEKERDGNLGEKLRKRGKVFLFKREGKEREKN